MSVEYTNYTFHDITNKILNNSSFLKLFNILKEDNTYFFNIFRSYNINPDILNNISNFLMYDVENDDWWDNISFKYYNTPYFWWLLCLVNNVENPFEELEEGSQIKILKNEYIYIILKEIKNISEL